MGHLIWYSLACIVTIATHKPSHWLVYKILYSLFSSGFFFSYTAASSPLFCSVCFCSSPLKILASIFSFKERQINVVLSSSCLSVWLIWKNYYSLILGGCSVKRAIHTEFYSEWHESTFKRQRILYDSIICEIFLTLSIYFCHC